MEKLCQIYHLQVNIKLSTAINDSKDYRHLRNYVKQAAKRELLNYLRQFTLITIKVIKTLNFPSVQMKQSVFSFLVDLLHNISHINELN